MANFDSSNRQAGLTDYISVLWKWKRFLLITSMLIFGITVGILFLFPNTYKATSIIFIPPDNSGGMGGLTSLLSGKTGALGAKLFGISNTSEDMLIGIMNSRTALTRVIKKFGLIEYYKVREGNIDKTIKAFVDDLSFGPNEHAMIEVSVVHENPRTAADIANYFVFLADSMNGYFTSEQARNSRLFIEGRYLKNLADLKTAEENMQRFQQKYGVFAVPQQFEVAVKAAAELEAQLLTKEISSYFVKQQFGEASPQYQGLAAEIKLLRQKVDELKNADKLSNQSNVMFPFKNAPAIAVEYIRNYREVEIQTKILEITLPLFEQAKVDEQKSAPSIQILDKALPPMVKNGPKRAFISAAITFLFVVLLIIYVFMSDKFISGNPPLNSFEEKLQAMAKKTAKLFGIRANN